MNLVLLRAKVFENESIAATHLEVILLKQCSTMKLIFSLLLLLSAAKSACQPLKSREMARSVLITAIQSDAVKTEFAICNFECGRLELFDLNNVIDDRPIDVTVCGKKLYQHNTQSEDHPSPNSIVVYRFDVMENGWVKIYFFRKYTGAAVIQTYSIEGGITLQHTEIGTF